MKIKDFKHCWAIAFILWGGFIKLYGQQQPDSLMQYLQIAAQNNPSVLQKFSEYQSALQKVPQAGSLSDPELNIGIFLSPMELVSGKQVAEIQLMQMFPWFGVLKNAKDEMSLMAQAKYEIFRDAKLQVFYEVQKTWYELYKIKQNIRISERNAEILRTLERIALVRYKTVSTGSSSGTSSSVPQATPSSSSSGSSDMNNMGNNGQNTQGSASPSRSMQSGNMGSSVGGNRLIDLYRIQIEIGNLENSIALMRNQYNTVAAGFNSYLNRPSDAAISIPDSIKVETLDVSSPAIADTIRNNHPMLSMLNYEQQSFAAREKMVSRMGYPMVGLGVNYSLIRKNEMAVSDMNGEDMIMPMIKVTLPVYRKKYKSMRNEAELMKVAANQNYQSTANLLQTEYFKALQLYEDAERRMILYRNQSLLAKKSLEIMIKSFSASESDTGLTDILAIRQQTLDYEFKQVEAVADFNTAIAWLKRLMSNYDL